jgi:hypothetical protein
MTWDFDDASRSLRLRPALNPATMLVILDVKLDAQEQHRSSGLPDRIGN